MVDHVEKRMKDYGAAGVIRLQVQLPLEEAHEVLGLDEQRTEWKVPPRRSANIL